MASVSAYAGELTPEQIEAYRAELIEEDGENLETPWHRDEINLLIDCIRWHLRGRTDFYVGGNMFIYYSRKQARERKYRGPDFFFVDHVDGKRERLYWWVVEEDGRLPDVIIELNSKKTKRVDLTTKKDLYERRFKTPEYFSYDPIKQKLLGWRLIDKRYQAIEPNEHGWLWSEQLQLWLGRWEGKYLRTHQCWLRFFDASGKLVHFAAEAMTLKAKRAVARAQHETERANALEQEVERLKAMLATKKNGKNGKPNGKN